LVFTILSAVAEAERDRIRERIATVKADQKARGRHLGGSRPFGYQIEGEGKSAVLVPDPAEQELIRAAAERHKAGSSYRAIALSINAGGHRVSHVALGRAIRDHIKRQSA
jgi:DNA invertase Pin-like site-specific DNA recombinase